MPKIIPLNERFQPPVEPLDEQPDSEARPHRKHSAEAVARGAVLFGLLSEAPDVAADYLDNPEKAIQPPIHSNRETETGEK